jgi:molybdenum cofactor cytidylyltransferase
MGRPKQLLPLAGKSVLQHVIDVAAEGRLAELLVVLGHRAQEVAASVRLPPRGRFVFCSSYRSGQSASLRAALRALGPDIGAVVILLGDQPGVPASAIRALVACYGRERGKALLASYAGARSHPVLLDRATWREVRRLRGDVGGRAILARHPEWIRVVEVGGRPPPDLDTWRDYQRLRGAR